jgi:hypothetical protein
MRRPRTFAPISFAFLLAGVCLSMAPAYAQEAVDEKKVNALFAEAREAFVAGDYATACPKYEEVVRLKPGLGARIGLGDCYRAQGRLAKAWDTYKAVVEEAPLVVKRAKGFTEQSKARKRGEEAQARVKEIQPRIAFVVVVVPDAILTLPDAVVQLDGITLDKARFGIRIPVDKGDHVVDVSAPGKKAWGKNVTLGEGAEYSVAVEPLEDDVPPVKVVPPDTSGNTGTATNSTGVTIAPVGGDKPPPDDKRPPVGGKNSFFSTQRIVGLSLGAVGVGAVVAGAAFGLQAIEKRNESEEGGHCLGNRCDDIGLPLRQASYDAGNASTGLFIGGGVALAAGALLFLTAPKRPAAVQATVVLGPSSLHCIGRF